MKKEEIIFFPTCNVTFKRGIFYNYRFDEDFPLPAVEDLEFCWRLFQNGIKFLQNIDMKVLHNRRNDVKSFFRQAYYYGRGNLLVQNIHMNHPLLKELKTSAFSFWLGEIVNFIKIPRFAYAFTRRSNKEYAIKGALSNINIFVLFSLHKIFYILGNIREFLEIKRGGILIKDKGLKAKPRMLLLDVTHSCNLSCRICDIYKTGQNTKNLGYFHIKRVLYEAKRLGIPEVALSGGEPLLRSDIFRILSYAKKIKISNLGVLTNGLLVAKYLDKLKPYLSDNTISLVVSFDSLKPDIHNYIRNSSSAWQQTHNALIELAALKKRCPRVNFNVISIILDHNLEELPELAGYVKSLGANSLQFQTLLANNLRMAQRGGSEFFIPEKRLSVLDGIVDELVEFKMNNESFVINSVNNLNLVKKYFRRTLVSGDVRCLSAQETILISSHGECTTCFSQYGNIMRSSLRKILSGQVISQAQDEVRNCRWPCLLPCFCDR